MISYYLHTTSCKVISNKNGKLVFLWYYHYHIPFYTKKYNDVIPFMIFRCYQEVCIFKKCWKLITLASCKIFDDMSTTFETFPKECFCWVNKIRFIVIVKNETLDCDQMNRHELIKLWMLHLRTTLIGQ